MFPGPTGFSIPNWIGALVQPFLHSSRQRLHILFQCSWYLAICNMTLDTGFFLLIVLYVDNDSDINNHSIKFQISKSINQSIDHSIGRSVSHSINQAGKQVASQSVSQSLNQSISQTVNQSANQSVTVSTYTMPLQQVLRRDKCEQKRDTFEWRSNLPMPDSNVSSSCRNCRPVRLRVSRRIVSMSRASLSPPSAS